MSHLLRIVRRAAATLVVAALALTLFFPTSVEAHSLDSTTASVVVGEDGVDTSFTIALAALDDALGTTLATDPSSLGEHTDEVTDYLAQHLTVTGADGSVWAESFSDLTVESVEGIDSLTVDVSADAADADPSSFTFAYDGVVEAVDGHEVVVVLTDASGDISTAGVIDQAGGSVTVGDVTSAAVGTTEASTGVLDMIGYGFHHVLDGADHLLFLLALLLPAPLLVAGRRWAAGKSAARSLGSVVRIATAFTVGHSVTLVAAAMGWVNVPSGPVEVLIALSVAVAAAHAVRPLVRRGESVIAAGFGLVHGLAFAGILADLGLDGTASWTALLAFNVGIELAQLVTIALTFPALYVLSRTRWYTPARLTGAIIALVAAAGWALDRLGVLANPLTGLEEAVIARPWVVVAGLAAVAAAALVHQRVAPDRDRVAA
ncbi:HupE/UreJ family protein [Promicromonospora sp. NFX87]|uniref:HupE/UreJ family protein n=1 Tax=Promicromonospora sp. NFX87 TaxID=3402691 RepID=UPI003AFAF801